MRPIKKVRFVDYDGHYDPLHSFIYRTLSEYYDLRIVDDPDYIFDGGLGYHHLKYDCIKIATIGENTAPDFNAFDYATGFDPIGFGDRYVRLPLFVFYGRFAALQKRERPADERLLNRKFCSFVVSNAEGDPIREKFFRRLSEYRQVDSGGGWLNNIGGRVEDKVSFCRGYKFNIAFENSKSDGYTTEKIMEAYAANAVPIYFGSPTVFDDFRAESMIYVRDENDVERAVEEVIRLDQDDAAYLAMCKAECLVHTDCEYYRKKFVDFVRNVFDRPIEEARRLNRYGYQERQRRTTKPFLLACQFVRDVVWFVFELVRGRIRKRFT